MAKNALVTDEFTDAMIKSGAALLRRLDTDGADVRSAFWFYFSDVRSWKLIIASPKVDLEGPREFYKRIVKQNKVATKNEYVLSLNDIGVTNMSNTIVVLLGMAVGTPSKGICEVRFSRNTVNGHFIEDAYIYRSNIYDENKPDLEMKTISKPKKQKNKQQRMIN